MTVARCATRAARHCCGRCNHGGPSGGNCRDDSTQAHDARSVSVDYLVEHGTCIDHIRPGYSTLPNSEQSRRFRGAASQGRNCHYGVAPSPSAIVYLHEHVQFHQASRLDGSWYRMVDEVDHFQLVYNYCYGTSDSSLLLCPYGSGVNYRNHNKSLTNVRMQWATKLDIVHNRMAVEKGTILDLAISPKPQLAMQYVARKDISAGAELFLDYGDAWEEAWLEHVVNYQGGPK